MEEVSMLDKIAGVMSSIVEFMSTKEALIVIIGGGVLEAVSRIFKSDKIVSVFRQVKRVVGVVRAILDKTLGGVMAILEGLAKLLDKLVPDKTP